MLLVTHASLRDSEYYYLRQRVVNDRECSAKIRLRLKRAFQCGVALFSLARVHGGWEAFFSREATVGSERCDTVLFFVSDKQHYSLTLYHSDCARGHPKERRGRGCTSVCFVVSKKPTMMAQEEGQVAAIVRQNDIAERARGTHEHTQRDRQRAAVKTAEQGLVSFSISRCYFFFRFASAIFCLRI